MKFSIADEIFTLFPTYCVGVLVAENAQSSANADARQCLADAAVVLRRREGGESARSIPGVRVWRDAFLKSTINPNKFPPSIEALVTRVLKGGELASVNCPVDLANAIAIKHLLPVGAHSLDRASGDIEVRYAREGDTFRALGNGGVENVPPGEIVYAQGSAIRTRRWVWRQGEDGKVSETTKHILFPIDGFLEATFAEVEEALTELTMLVEQHLGAKCRFYMLDADTRHVDLDSASSTIPRPKEGKDRLMATRRPDIGSDQGLADLSVSDLMTRGMIEEIIVEKEFVKLVDGGRRLTVYQGFDPTSPNLHIGHLVSLRILRWFQLHGHRVIFLIGDFTARIGDPTDKTATRTKLSHDEVLRNAQTYEEQAGVILDFAGANPVEVRFNSDWLESLTFKDIIELAANATVQQMLERDMFQERIRSQRPIALHEFLYPLLQGYDSVAMEVDAELGGRDQLFNMLVGRDLVRVVQHRAKHVLTTPLLVGLDGRKMGKTEGNTVNLTEHPVSMFQKLTQIQDQLLPQFLSILTDASTEEIGAVELRLKEGESNLLDARECFAFQLVSRLHGEEAANRAQDEFRRVVVDQQLPSDVETIELRTANLPTGGLDLVSLLVAAKQASSRAEARRLVTQAAVEINGERKTDVQETLPAAVLQGALLRVGRKKPIRLIVTPGAQGGAPA